MGNHLTDFDYTLEEQLISPEDHPPRQTAFRSDDVGGFGEQPVGPVSFFDFLFGYFVTPIDRIGGWADFDDLCVIRRLSAQPYAFGGSVDTTPHLGGHIIKKKFGGVNSRFLSQTSKMLKLPYCRNYYIDSNQTLHNDEDHQVVFVVSKYASRKSKTADSRHFENPLNCDIFATVWPILTKCGTVEHIGPLRPIHW